MIIEVTHRIGAPPVERLFREISMGMGRAFSTTRGAFTTRSQPAMAASIANSFMQLHITEVDFLQCYQVSSVILRKRPDQRAYLLCWGCRQRQHRSWLARDRPVQPDMQGDEQRAVRSPC